MNKHARIAAAPTARRQRCRPGTVTGPIRCATVLLFLITLIGVDVDRLSAQRTGVICDSVSITPRYVSDGCCWDFDLVNKSTLQPFDDITVTTMTSGATVTSASGGLPTSTTANSANYAFPNYLPVGTTTVRGCFDAPAGFTTVIFEWKYQGKTICRDTFELDCPRGQKDTCETDSLKISTGWNPYTQSLHSVGDYTTFWQVIADPDATTTEPRPASVIAKNPAWDGPLGTSQWISSYPTATNDLNGTYVFQTCFCVKEDFRNVRLVFDILADDRAKVYVNGNHVGGTPLSWGFKNPANHVDTNIAQFIRPGRNCIRVEVENTQNVAMGLDLDGYITSDGIGLEKSTCCDPETVLTGTKFNDLNCNGRRDSGEPGIPGWKIVLSNGDTATTDGLGNYYFYNIAPGNYVLAEINQTGWTQSYPAAPGTHAVSLPTGGAIGGLDFGNCRETQQKECFEYRPDTTICEGQHPAGTSVYLHQFRIRPLLPCQYSYAAGFTSLTPGVSVSPNSIPSLPNGWSPQTLVVTGPGAIPGTTVLVEVTICCVAGQPGGVQDTIDCCKDTIRFVLPECGDPNDCKDCCDEFPKRFERLSQWSSSSGFTSVKGLLQAGNTKICTVSATLVDARINGQPTWGRFIPTNVLGGSPGTIPYMHEVVWTGVDVSGSLTPFGLRLQFPGISRNRLFDRIDYCVRFRFTDENCVTCDTVICFSQRRIRWIFSDGISVGLNGMVSGENGPAGTWLSGESGPAGMPGERWGGTSRNAGEVGTFEGALTESGKGRLTVNFPAPPAELGDVTYVGLEIAPGEEFVEITGGTSADATYAPKRGTAGIASSPFSLAPGTSTTVEMTYNDATPDRSRLDHWITIRFVRASDPSDTLEETGRVTLYRENFRGGDLIDLGLDAPGNAQTYALYLQAKNGSEEPLAGLSLNAPKGVEILAVGPGTDEQNVDLLFLDDRSGDAAAIDLSGLAGQLDAGGTLGPIYLTVATDLKEFDLDFTTRNRFGTTVSEGSVTVENDPTSVGSEMIGLGSDNRSLTGLHPNPADRTTTVEISLASSERDVSITILDASGRTVTEPLASRTMRSGEHRLLVETGDLPSGAYHVVLTTADGTVETMPLRVQR